MRGVRLVLVRRHLSVRNSEHRCRCRAIPPHVTVGEISLTLPDLLLAASSVLLLPK